MRRFFDIFARDERGSATVEFVLWLPMILIVFFLTVDGSMIFFSQSQVLRVAQDANRDASIGRFHTPAEVEAFIEGQFQNISPTLNAVSVISSGVIETTVTYPARDFQIFNFFGELNSIQMTVNSGHLIENWEEFSNV